MARKIGTVDVVDGFIGDKLIEARYAGDKKYFDAYTTVTGSLPLMFNGRAEWPLKNYRLYGTASGAGVATESGEPAGFKIPISLSDGTSTSNYDLMIGDSKLGEEEYVDFSEQKIYKDVSGTITPTDPPAPLPAIDAYQGENTLSSTETLGEVTVKGRISEISP